MFLLETNLNKSVAIGSSVVLLTNQNAETLDNKSNFAVLGVYTI